MTLYIKSHFANKLKAPPVRGFQFITIISKLTENLDLTRKCLGTVHVNISDPFLLAVTRERWMIQHVHL